MDFATTSGEQEYAALVRAADHLVVGLDFDGTLAPIVENPESAHIHPDAGEVLVALAAQVRAVAVITGRPARQALALGGLEEIGNAIGESGRELFVLGQYGNERWTSTDRRVISPKPPRGLATFMGEVPRLLRRADAADAWVEEKGLAVAVHTRRLEDPEAAFERLLPLLTEAAQSHDLDVEPGRWVVEVRAHGMHKGAAVRRLTDEVGARAFVFCGDDLGDVEAFKAVEVRARGMHKGAAVRRLTDEVGARAFVFCGDDLGDVEAFKAVEELRGQGLPSLLVCSASDEQNALAEMADVVVSGPGGVLDLLRELTADIRASRA